MTATRPTRASGFTVIELVVSLLIVGVLLALLLPSVTRSREPARRTQCKNNLKQIGLALHNYHDVWGAFPPAYTVDADGKPLHSWRTLLLPYLDHAPLYAKIDLTKPWDDPANAEALETRLPVYSCPSDGLSKPGQTTYLAIVTSLSCLTPIVSRSVRDITDGTSHTLAVIEVKHHQAVHWMSPHDTDETAWQPTQEKLISHHAGGGHALMADGTVRFLSENLHRDTWNALCTATGGETIGDF